MDRWHIKCKTDFWMASKCFWNYKVCRSKSSELKVQCNDKALCLSLYAQWMKWSILLQWSCSRFSTESKQYVIWAAALLSSEVSYLLLRRCDGSHSWLSWFHMTEWCPAERGTPGSIWKPLPVSLPLVVPQWETCRDQDPGTVLLFSAVNDAVHTTSITNSN